MKNITLKQLVAGAIVTIAPLCQIFAQDNGFFRPIPNSDVEQNNDPRFFRQLPNSSVIQNGDPKFFQKIPNAENSSGNLNAISKMSEFGARTYFDKLGISGRPAKTAKFYAGSPTQTKVDGALSFDMVENGKTTATVTYLYEQGQVSKISVSGDPNMAGLYSVETLKTPAGNLPMDYSQFANGTPIVLFGGYKKVTDKNEIEDANKKIGELLLGGKPKELPFEEAYKLSASKDASIRGASLSASMQRWNAAVFMTSAFDPADVERKRQAKEVEKLFGNLGNQDVPNTANDAREQEEFNKKIREYEQGTARIQAERKIDEANREEREPKDRLNLRKSD